MEAVRCPVWGLAHMSRKDVQALGTIALFYLLLETLGVTCPIRFLTGVSCAGCGMSRAWWALLHLDLPTALQMHPLFWLPVPAAVLLLARDRLPERVRRVGLGICAGLFAVVYFVRLLLPGDVVIFAPQEGLLWRLISGIGERFI